jgi:adenosylhomocysteine nucleosidase
MSDPGPTDRGEATAPRGRTAPAPLAADVGIVAAMGMEVGFLTDRLAKVRKYAGPNHSIIEGEAGTKLVALIIGGMGRDAARRATRLLIDGHRPRWVISAGFAGALDPALERYDLVMPTEIVDVDGLRLSVDVNLPTNLETPTRGPLLKPGRLLTVDAIVRTAAEKAALRAKYEADVVDMETSAVAAICGEREVRFLSLRVVSDEAGVDLPREIASLVTRSGSYRVGAALRAIWNRPSSLKDFWSLHEHSQEAADRLAAATLSVIEHLPA